MSAVELAKALVEVREGMDGNSKFFQTTGRSVLASLLRVAKSQEQLWALANLPAEDLELVLKTSNELSHRYLGQGESGQASGVIATALMNLSFLKFLNHHVRERETRSGVKEVPFSIREWVMSDDDKRWVFLVATDSHWEDNRSLIRLWFDIASTAVLERNKGQNTSPIWLVCDEISTIGNLPTLPKVLDRGYKYDGTLVIGFQSLAQIEQIYGAEGARNIIQGLQNIVVFACNENQLSRDLAERIGRFEVEEAESTHSTGDGKAGSRFSVSVKSKDRLSVTPDEIKCLRENHGILKLARFPPTRISFNYIRFPEIMARSATQSDIPAQSWVELRTQSHAKETETSKTIGGETEVAKTSESPINVPEIDSSPVQRSNPFLTLEKGASRKE
jgi:type IV secretory pathway TraG/TraD family ATPase VirD4